MTSSPITFYHAGVGKRAVVCGCEQCGHLWLSVDLPRNPKRCASCKSMKWNFSESPAGLAVQRVAMENLVRLMPFEKAIHETTLDTSYSQD